jgi:pimeloyl-ACP methyl ester carboxylesterase
VGHSFGAILAVAYAAAHPDQVRRLVLVSLPFFGGESAARRHFQNSRSVEHWVLRNMLFAALACVASRWALRRALPPVLGDMPREVVEDLVQHTWRSFTSTMWEGIYRYDLRATADRLPPDLRVLCLHGESDPTAPLEGVRSLRMRYPTWSLSVLGDADHHPLLRDPAWCRAWIRRAVTA